MSRYSLNPLEQSFQKWDKEFKRKRNDYWRRLRLAMLDFGPIEGNNFKEWMLTQWGVEVGTDEEGSLTAYYKVIDERKYMLFMLKYV